MKSYIDPLVENNPYTLILHKHPYRMCTKSVMDTSDPWIEFNEEGVCNHVLNYERYEKTEKLSPEQKKNKIEKILVKLKSDGKGKAYDCIMGLSGGVDSSYMAWYVTKKLGLRALVVHVDTGWNSELAVSNIQNIVQKLNLDLHTLVIDWEEIRDLQLSFFKASIANLDVPQDHSFIASLVQEARKYGIKYIMNGSNMSTESILPNAWGYSSSDAKHLLGIHKLFGKVKIKSYPVYSLFKKYFYYPYFVKMETITPLEFIEYNKDEAKKFLMEELGWRDYGGKHYESKFTKFFQAHYLPEKFGYDKRKAHLSSLIVSGQMTRDEALTELKQPLYDPIELEEDRIYFAKKLGISLDEYYHIMAKPPKTYVDYPNAEKFEERLSKVIRFLSKTRNFLLRQNTIKYDYNR
jgi:N-acetyl sugar amidotransferase